MLHSRDPFASRPQPYPAKVVAVVMHTLSMDGKESHVAHCLPESPCQRGPGLPWQGNGEDRRLQNLLQVQL